MAETFELEIFRYRPEEESEPTFQTYEVPYREDWVVLDALNYIKDQIDGTSTTGRFLAPPVNRFFPGKRLPMVNETGRTGSTIDCPQRANRSELTWAAEGALFTR